jgi:hypothetical protein
MRILSLVFSFLVTVSLSAVALTYMEGRIGQHRIQVQDEWLSSSHEEAYHSYGQVMSTDPDTIQFAVNHRDSLPGN